MKNVKQALTIAGSDSGGGAGIQADLKTFQERKVFGMSIIVAVTAQNTLGVQGSYPLPLEAVQAQFNSIFSDFKVSAMKTGMLVGSPYIQLIAAEIQKRPEIPYVLDPVMIAKGGSALVAEDAIADLIEYLVPLTTLITPNIPEAERIADVSIQTKEDMVKVAKIIQKQGAKNVLLKGGHLEGSQSEVTSDYLLLENGEGKWFENDRIYTENTHGTGDTLASCIVAELAKGKSMKEAVEIGIDFVYAAISNGIDVGHGHGPTNHWAYRKTGRRTKLMVRNALNVYFIAGSQNIENGDLLSVLEEALVAGITMFQFREKGPNSLEGDPIKKRKLAIQCQALCQKYEVPFIINDDVELGISIEADGIHVGQDDEPIEEVLRRVAPDTIIGLSTSNAQEVADAENVEGLDYIGLGPVFITESKEDTDPELGIKGLTEIIRDGKTLPIVAIGGISSNNASDIRKTGVDGLAVISAITKSDNIKGAVEKLKGNSFE